MSQKNTEEWLVAAATLTGAIVQHGAGPHPLLLGNGIQNVVVVERQAEVD